MNASKLMALLTRVLLITATFAMVVMATIIAMNILGRSLFGRPILGTIDIAGLAGVVFASIAVGYTEWERRNVVMEVIVARFPPRVKAFTDAFGLLLSLGIIGVLTWAMFKEAAYAASFSQTTLVTKLPLAPFKYVWSIGATLLGAILLRNAIVCIVRGFKR